MQHAAYQLKENNLSEKDSRSFIEETAKNIVD